ncbi:MAG: hypothetical protein H6509_09285 [Bryobacterales bacterium]|nr:hypothetical protein [Acidobacteriota bacterium]MCB9384797.1 hypothetical protein [Bryobacterales bacterium]
MSPIKPIFPKAPEGVREKRIESRFPSMSEIEISWIDAVGNVKTAEAKVMNSSDNGLGLKTHTRLAANTMIWMRDIAGELVKAVVRFSRNHEDGDWQTGVRLIQQEKRGAGRDPVRGAAELKWPGPTGATSSMVVRVVDLSENGAGVLAPRALPEGQFVQLIGDQFECFCSVRNSREVDDGCVRLGLLFAREPHDRSRGVTADWMD